MHRIQWKGSLCPQKNWSTRVNLYLNITGVYVVTKTINVCMCVGSVQLFPVCLQKSIFEFIISLSYSNRSKKEKKSKEIETCIIIFIAMWGKDHTIEIYKNIKTFSD